MKSGFDRYRAGVILWICATLIACGGGDKNNPQLGLVSPTFAPDKQVLLKPRREEVGIRLMLPEADIDCILELTPDLKFQNLSCPSTLPNGRYTYRLEYYIKTSKTLIAWGEGEFTSDASDMDINLQLIFDIDDDADDYNNFEEFLANTNPKEADDYPSPPPEPGLTAPPDRTKEASAEKTPVDLGEPNVVGFDETNVSITHDAPAEGFDLGETPVIWTATDGNLTKTATQRILIEDTTAPVFTNNLSEITEITTEDSITLGELATPAVTDIFSVKVTSNAPTPLTYAVGTHKIIWTATDANGNQTTKPQNLVVTVVETLPEPSMVTIPEGVFKMGDESSSDGVTPGFGDSDEVPVHTVTVAAFEMGKYEVTFAEYDLYLSSRGVDINNITWNNEGHDYGWGRGNRPVVEVSWSDIQGYLEWLNTQQGIALDDVKRYRLPTEAEWEYAARGGTTTAYSTGDCIDTSQANYDGDFKSDDEWVSCPAANVDRRKTEVVGSFAVNPFGLHDMHGNVWEWVEDCGSLVFPVTDKA